MLDLLHRLLPENSRQYREEVSQRIAWGHWFAFFNIVLALIIASRYAFSADWPSTLLGRLYFFVSLFGHFSFVIFAFYLLLLFPLSFIIKNNRTFRGISVLIATIGLTILIVDSEVFNRFFLHLSPLVWDLLVNPDNGELSRHWQLLFVPMPLILLLQMLYSRWCWYKLRSFNRQVWGKYVAFFFLSCFVATHVIYALADIMLYRPITAQKANYPLSYPMTARTFLAKHHLINLDDFEQRLEERGRLDTFFIDYPKKALNITQKPNVNLLFINISGLKNAWINEKMMPELAKISRTSHRFMNHYSSGDTERTGVMGLFYGLSGKYMDAVLSEKVPSPFITALEQSNYQFGLFSYNSFDDPLYHRALFAGHALPQAKHNLDAIEQWKGWLNQRKNQPFFSYLALKTPVLNNPEQSAKLLDWQFSTIWQQLVAQGLLANTLVIITADLAEKDIQANAFSAKRIQVPMMMYWQGETKYYTHLSSHLDIVPTLLSQFLGVRNPTSDYSQGVDLTHTHERIWVLASNYRWNVAIMPDGEQYHLDKNGHFEKWNPQDQPEKTERPPLALFLQLIQTSNQFIDK